LLARREFEPDPESAQHLARGWTAQLSSTRQSDKRRCAAVGRHGLLPGVRQPVGACKLEHAHRRLRTTRTDDLQAYPVHALQRLAPGDERGEEQIAEQAVLVEER